MYHELNPNYLASGNNSDDTTNNINDDTTFNDIYKASLALAKKMSFNKIISEKPLINEAFIVG